MYAQDFEYDGQFLSDYCFVICTFDGSSGIDTVSAGSKITFNTIQRHYGKKYSLTGTTFDECIQSSFDICKDPCIHASLLISPEEYRSLMRWLNRRNFLKFQLLPEEMTDSSACWYEASFNIDKIMSDGMLCGLRLTMETNKPFGYGQEQRISWVVSDTSKVHLVHDISDEPGYIYPSMTVIPSQNGDLTIYNALEDCTTQIKNCSAGEVITVDGDTLSISSSLNSHQIYNDFNFEFLRIGNTLKNRSNPISVSLPCSIELRYFPVVKDAPE